MEVENMNWSYIMNIALATLCASLIAVAGSIVVHWLGNRKGYKDVDRKIGTLDNTTLSGQHNKMTDDIIRSVNDNSKELSNKLENKIGTLENTTLSGQNNDIIKRIDDMTTFLKDEREMKLQKSNLLGYDMQKINISIENLSGFADIMKDLYSENTTLKSENEKLQVENERLKTELSQYQNPTHNLNTSEDFNFN